MALEWQGSRVDQHCYQIASNKAGPRRPSEPRRTLPARVTDVIQASGNAWLVDCSFQAPAPLELVWALLG